VTADERAELARGFRTAAVFGGWFAVAGVALVAVGILAELGWLVPGWLAVLAAVGVGPLLIGGVASIVCDQLAGWYGGPVDDDGEVAGR
jgi:hypothetical protein